MSNIDQNSKNNPPLSEPLYGATFKQSIVRFFKKYARFSGYASRSEYWWATLFLVLLSFIPSIMLTVGMVMISEPSTSANGYGTEVTYTNTDNTLGMVIFILSLIILFIFWLATIVPSLALSWRRLHDAGFSGLLYFISFIPYLGGLVLIIFFILPSKPEARKPQWNDNKND